MSASLPTPALEQQEAKDNSNQPATVPLDASAPKAESAPPAATEPSSDAAPMRQDAADKEKEKGREQKLDSDHLVVG